MEMRPFMASVAVIFGVDFTGPHILVVIFPLSIDGSREKLLCLDSQTVAPLD